MTEMITAVYSSHDSLRNVVDDLVSTGIPQEKIRINDANFKVQVAVANTAGPEVTEILERHQPVSLQSQTAAD
jgi:hypothetical protein